jgi:NAD(P)-dependent dehydrogenase (short-subunit alcohol dehydrogenase family)
MSDLRLPGLDGKQTIVVGGGSGIGRATASMLAAAGAHVAVADVDGGRAEQVRDELVSGGAKAVAVSGDVTTPDGAGAVVGEAHDLLGGLTGVVNIVGVAGWGPLLDMDLAAWETDLRMNLTHHLLVAQAAARHMIADGTGGALAMVTSVSGLYGAPNHAAYGAAKAGAMALARSIANEWAPHGIRANCVAPDIIKTPRVVASFEAQGVADIDAIAAGEGVPLARWGTPDEIAGPLVFLLSDLSSFMTGQTLVVDGGTQALFPHGGKKAFDQE